MTSEAKKQILRVWTAVVALVLFRFTFAPSSHGALYDGDPPAGSVWNAPGDSDSKNRRKTQAYSTSAGTVYFFRIHPFGPYDNSPIHGPYFDNGRYRSAFAEDFSSDTAFMPKGESAPSPDIGGNRGGLWGPTSGIRESLQDFMEPIPSSAWFLALGIIGLVALKRRRRRR